MNRKTYGVVLLAGLLATAACNTKTQENKETTETAVIDTATNDPVEVLETEAMAVQENASDVHFMAALDDFSQKKLPQAAQQLQEGIEAFRQETASYTGKSKQLAESVTGSLKKLEEQLKKGQTPDLAALDNAVAKAQNVAAHQVFFTVEETLIPEKATETQNTFAKALAHLKKSVEKDKSAMKAEGEKLVREGEEMETKLKKGEQVEAAKIKDFTTRCKTWLEKHA
jgi:Sec-independent protein translocase protein TatA